MSLAHYLLQINIYLIVFYGFYKLLLDKETYFMLNRIYLVSAGVLSLCIPFIRLEWLTEQRAAQQVYTTVNWEAMLAQASVVTTPNPGLNWGNLIVYVYCAGILFFLGRLVFNLIKVKRLIARAKTGSAFSFFKKKVIDSNLPKMEVIDIHEETHIKQWHSLDILFFEVLGIVTWLNPVIYLYKHTIRNIHEFLADEKAAAFQGDKAEYSMLLLSKSFGIAPHSLANGFFRKSMIKKRIFMLHKERSKKTAVMKYGIFIPLFAILIVFSSATVRKNENLISISEQLPLEKPMELVQEMVTKPIENEKLIEKTAATVSIKGQPEEQWRDFYRFVGGAVKYPVEAHAANFQGNTQIKFTLKNGRVNSISANVDLGYGCDEEVMKTILSYKKFDQVADGKYAIKVSFKLSGLKEGYKNEKIADVKGYQNLSGITIISFPTTQKGEGSNEQVFDFVSIDKQPEFPGGVRKFYEYLGASIRYPKKAKEDNVQGKVFLSFVVEKDGKLSDIRIIRGLSKELDEEAIRVLESSPNWNPGIVKGEPIRSRYNINVNFALNNLDKPTEAEPKNKSQNLTGQMGSIKIRGNNETFKGLYVLDGEIVDNDILKTLDANAIESISVLKDQSAISLYGQKGKDGVIIVTTKSARKDKAPLLDGKS
ncbi:M56 family metallopeptidase [Pedobacter rhizosphaerae]|uniref:Outer membrane transport energization protein TonB n=1 Tax=Pedobacter rhizosphaerae TaxID=390241 RepID=A0A1H9LKN1_9SPHI|nr:M56 family metallopeptidase [Pedobacter rhizosphaerae]SER11928.1 outer membrane transport energization protein TonB [Pedobacter rhizosphaerae]